MAGLEPVSLFINQANDDETPPSSFHRSPAPTYQTSRGTEASITAVPPPRGQVVQDSWIQAPFLGQRLHHAWIDGQLNSSIPSFNRNRRRVSRTWLKPRQSSCNIFGRAAETLSRAEYKNCAVR